MNDALTILRALAQMVEDDGHITLDANSSTMRDIRLCLGEAARAKAEKDRVLREADTEDELWNGGILK